MAHGMSEKEWLYRATREYHEKHGFSVALAVFAAERLLGIVSWAEVTPVDAVEEDMKEVV